MADVKNFGLIGVGTNVQFGKASSRIINNAGTFNFKNAAGSGDVAITTAGITSSAGNVTLTTGNLVMSSAAGTLSVNGDTTLSRHGAGIFQFDGTAAVVMPTGTTAQQPTAAGNTAAFRYNSTTGSMEFSNGTVWNTLATGGVAVTAVSVVSANGLAGTSSGGTTPALTLSTTVTGILKGDGTAISAAVSGTDLKTVGGNTIIGSGDVGTIGPTYGGTGLATFAAGTVLYASATDTWAAAAPGATSGVQPYDAGLTALAAKSSTGIMVQTGADTYTSRTLVAPAAGITISNADGVAGNPTLALANDLAAIEGLTTTGYAVRVTNLGGITALTNLAGGSGYLTPGTYLGVALTGGSGTGATADITVTGTAVSAVSIVNPGSGYLATDTGLSALDASIGGRSGGSAFTIDVSTVSGESWTTRSISGTAGRIAVSNGNGVASNTDIDLVTVTDSGTGTFLKITRDTYGRVSGTTAVVANDIETLVNGTYVNVTGDTMSGNLVMSGVLTQITLPNTPLAGTDATNKAYVDMIALNGSTWVSPVNETDLVDIVTSVPGSPAASTAYIAYGGSYPQTWGAITTVAQNDILSWNGSVWAITGTLTAGARYIIAAEHGTIGGTLGAVIVGGHTLINSDLIQFVSGNPTLGASWTLPSGTAGAGGTMAQGTTALNANPLSLDYSHTYLYNATTYLWIEIAGPGSITAGVGLSWAGSVLNVNLGAGIKQLPSDEIGIDVSSGKAVQLTGSATGDTLTFVLDEASLGDSGLTQSSSGLKIQAGKVTNAMLTNPSITVNGDTGTFSQALGGTLILSGDASQGVSSTATAGTVDFTVQNAGYTGTKGVAAFTATEFVVTSGVVQIGVIGNGNLANSSITFTGDSGSAGAIALGGTLSITGDGSLITTAGTAGNIDITLGTVNVAHGGTGQVTLLDTGVMIGNGTSPVETSTELTFDSAAGLLTVGGANGMTITANGGAVTIASLDTNANINLTPAGTGAVVIGPAGAGLIQSDTGQPLTVRGNTILTLESGTGDIVMLLSGTTANKVTISGPTAAQYATSLANEDLVNKYYVDTVAGSATGDVKAVKATVDLTDGTTNIGAALPAGATILSVKVNVTSVDTGSGTLVVGKSGNTSAYMTAVENDTQVQGLYLAETSITEAASEQVISTGAGATSGSAVVIVTYMLA